ncbi:SRPBCC domain-containing protein [Kutzneria sp. NPDC052558]|uniref:SRPBCC domain-containing protein n=1 Tax=Kutzneria sp. NPDC052558 TaxID=3364121 RepID=UPI0037C873F7
MPTVETTSSIVIPAPPARVYETVTSPENWLGTHPVTVGVLNAPARPAVSGEHWTEVIRTPAGQTADLAWTVDRAEPPRRWEISTDRLLADHVRCVITYTFAEQPGATLFTRRMAVTYPDGALDDQSAARFGNPAVHDQYLANVKKLL